MLGVASCTPKEVKVIPYEPFKKFSMEVDHEEWHGKLEPGRYTKNGILIINQNGK
jgi:hypothetical protein